MNPAVLTVSHGVAVAAFLILAVIALRRPAPFGPAGVGTAVAAVITAAWAGMVAALPIVPDLPVLAPEAVRGAAWLAVLGGILGLWRKPVTAVALAGVMVLPLAAGVLGGGAGLVVTALVVLAVAGLALVEQLLRRAEEERWTVKHFCFGLGLIFAYDVFLHADALLLGRPSVALLEARGVVDALAVPLMAVSALRFQGERLRLSRSAAFHSVAVLGAGVYLLGMAAVGWVVKETGGSWGAAGQVAFLAASAVLLAVVLASGAARAQVRMWLARHFFQYRYDYREEWLRFVRTVAPDGGADLRERVVRAMADIVESTGGAVWLHEAGDCAYLPAGEQNLGGRTRAVAEDDAFVAALGASGDIIDLRRPDAPEPPAWLQDLGRAWLVVPLPWRDGMIGFVILAEPRVRRGLTWEDLDILRTVSHHAAGYLAEERAMVELSDARRLADFNRRTAFVVHDVKNVVGQMALMLRNAETFGNDPEFQKDMLETVGHAVDRLQTLLTRIRADRAEGARSVPLDAAVRAAGERWARRLPALECAVEAIDRPVDDDTVKAVLDHVLQNAAEAAGPEGKIALRLFHRDAEAVVEVADDGPGMDPAFVRDQLFRPLATGKEDGFGLGAWQSREMARRLGGRLEVQTQPGAGTRVHLVLPAAVAETDRRGELTA